MVRQLVRQVIQAVTGAAMSWHWEAELFHRHEAAVYRTKVCGADMKSRSWEMEGNTDMVILSLDNIAALRAKAGHHQLMAAKHRDRRERWKALVGA